jgi:hypothetical protein
MPREKQQTVGSSRKALRGRAELKKPVDRLTMDTAPLEVNRLIADFMKISTRLERYLHKKGPLTDLQYESLSTTLEGLETFLLTWRTHFRTGKR